mmetsp:Transcript_138850/g.346157  ORF Transcript_138850/g.346157 Transcript_138850/m.346157 type:complete len:203 (-) Transcript_138850:1328-1936(-)
MMTRFIDMTPFLASTCKHLWLHCMSQFSPSPRFTSDFFGGGTVWVEPRSRALRNLPSSSSCLASEPSLAWCSLRRCFPLLSLRRSRCFASDLSATKPSFSAAKGSRALPEAEGSRTLPNQSFVVIPTLMTLLTVVFGDGFKCAVARVRKASTFEPVLWDVAVVAVGEQSEPIDLVSAVVATSLPQPRRPNSAINSFWRCCAA